MLRHIAAVLILSAAALVSLPAAARKPPTPALADAPLRAQPDDDSRIVAHIKAGDPLTTLGAENGFTRVMTKKGKRGWVHDEVVVAAQTQAGLGGDTTTLAANEGDTATALRGAGTLGKKKLKTIVVTAAGVSPESAKKLADLLRKDSRLYLLRSIPAEGTPEAGKPLGGLEGAEKIASSQKPDPDLLVGVMAGNGGALQYEVVDLQKKAVLATGEGAGEDAVASAVGGALPAASPASSPTPAAK